VVLLCNRALWRLNSMFRRVSICRKTTLRCWKKNIMATIEAYVEREAFAGRRSRDGAPMK
jgi:hypothetical protein